MHDVIFVKLKQNLPMIFWKYQLQWLSKNMLCLQKNWCVSKN